MLIGEQERFVRAGKRFAGAAKQRRERQAALDKFQEGGDWRGVEEKDRILTRADWKVGLVEARRAWMRSGRVQDLEAFLLERMLEDDDLVSGDFLTRGARVARCVGKLHVRFGGRAASGSCFMVSSRVLMTNHHVLKNALQAQTGRVEFDFVTSLDGTRTVSQSFALAPELFFFTSQALDYTVVALGADYDAAQSRMRGWLQLIAESGKTLVGERVNIIQHPQGGTQRVALRDNKMLDVAGPYLHYKADTDPGSSGSPVCNDEWLLAALHHSSVPATDDEGRILLADGSVWDQTPARAPRIEWIANEGVRISSIVADLQRQMGTASELQAKLFEECFLAPAAPEALAGTGAEASFQLSAGNTLRVEISLCGAGLGAASLATQALSPASARRVPSVLGMDSEGEGPPPGRAVFSEPELEAITVRIKGDVLDTSEAVKRLSLDGFIPEQVHASLPRDFDLRPTGALSAKEAWDQVHRLRADAQIEWADPNWSLAAYVDDEETELPASESFGEDDDENGNTRWPFAMLRVREAWELSSPTGKRRGEGIVVAHPDSGYSRHTELVEEGAVGGLDVAHGRNYVDDGPSDGLDTDGFHGTGTASLIISREKGQLTGVAPLARLIPMRVAQKWGPIPSPVLFRSGTTRLRKAIYEAIELGCHVISISLGWLGNRGLHEAIRAAWARDIIICAAAGNYTSRVVVWPGRYPETICLAGCSSDRTKWKGSARGAAVDFTAPAHHVWKAGWNDGHSVVKPSSGTSFATALTAGVAALWLAHHGPERLKQRYSGQVRLTDVFRWVLRESCDPPPPEHHGHFGRGIVNAKAALEQRLPTADQVRARGRQEALVLPDASELLGLEPGDGRSQLARERGVDVELIKNLDASLQDELAFHHLVSQSSVTTEAAEWGPGTGALSQRLSEALLRQ